MRMAQGANDPFDQGELLVAPTGYPGLDTAVVGAKRAGLPGQSDLPGNIVEALLGHIGQQLGQHGIAGRGCAQRRTKGEEEIGLGLFEFGIRQMPKFETGAREDLLRKTRRGRGIGLDQIELLGQIRIFLGQGKRMLGVDCGFGCAPTLDEGRFDAAQSIGSLVIRRGGIDLHLLGRNRQQGALGEHRIEIRSFQIRIQAIEAIGRRVQLFDRIAAQGRRQPPRQMARLGFFDMKKCQARPKGDLLVMALFDPLFADQVDLGEDGSDDPFHIRKPGLGQLHRDVEGGEIVVIEAGAGAQRQRPTLGFEEFDQTSWSPAGEQMGSQGKGLGRVMGSQGLDGERKRKGARLADRPNIEAGGQQPLPIQGSDDAKGFAGAARHLRELLPHHRFQRIQGLVADHRERHPMRRIMALEKGFERIAHLRIRTIGQGRSIAGGKASPRILRSTIIVVLLRFFRKRTLDRRSGRRLFVHADKVRATLGFSALLDPLDRRRQTPEPGLGPIVHQQIGSIVGADIGRGGHRIHKIDQRIVIALDIEQQCRLGMDADPGQGPDLEEFVHGPDPAGQDDESIRASEHQAFALCHGLDLAHFVDPPMQALMREKIARDDADDPSPGFEGGIGQRSHHALPATPVDEIDAAAGDGSPQTLRSIDPNRRKARLIAAKYAKTLDRHGSPLAFRHGASRHKDSARR
uniref:Uncharacterized protein n=1 Tax=Amphimedon queenslandica TaxID=400682 RepID=A0A1X7TJ73_AMPQE